MMIRNALLTIFLACILSIVQVTNGISVINGTYEIKSTSLTDVEVKTVFAEFTTDEPIMVPNGVACPVYNCPVTPEIPADCACDYTTLNGYCGDPLPGFSCSCTDQQLCNSTAYPWIDLPVNTKIQARASVGKFLQYRFILEDGCDGFIVRLYPVWGTPFLYVNRDGLSDPRTDPLGAITNSQRMFFYNLCPTESGHDAGTYFVSVLAALTDAEFQLEVTTQKAPSLAEQPPASDCGLLGSDQFCVDDSVPSNYACLSDFNQFLYELKGCQHLSISLKAITFGTDVDIYIAQDTWETFGTCDWSSYNTGDELLYLSVCPPAGQNSSYLYITVNCFITVAGANNYSLTVTSLSDWNYTAITDLPQLSAPWEIAGAGRLIISTAEDTSDSNNWVLCENWRFTCTEFVFVYPGDGVNPFWPIPPTIKNMIEFRYVQLPILTPTPKPNTISILIFISVAEDGTGSTIFPETNIDTFGMEFLGRLTNANGDPLTGIFKPNSLERVCNYPAFTQANELVLKVIDELDETSETVELVSLQFELGVLMYSNDWYPCDDFLTSLYKTETTSEQVLTRACVLASTDPDWQLDPCCWSVMDWYTPCVPRLVFANVVQYESIEDQMVSEYCSSDACVDTYLSDYQDYLQDLNTDNDLCSSSLASGQQNSSMSYVNYRYCKDLVWGSLATCYEDSDCMFYGAAYVFSCDLTSHTCIVPPESQESLFAICLLVTMTQYQLLYVQEEFSLPGAPLSVDFVEAYIAALRSHQDCVSPVGLDTSKRDHYELNVYDVNCANTNGCPHLLCDDTSCAIQENTCLTWCEAKSWKPFNSSQEQCEKEVYCNWDPNLCDGLTLSQCQAACNGPAFCGWCENGQDCVEFSSITDPATCNATSICVFANGSYALNIDPAVCKTSYPQCSQKCPMTCASQTSSTGHRCYDNSISSGTCTARGGSWNNSLATCFYSASNSSQCSTYNATFEDCGSVPFSVCYDCSLDPSLCTVNQTIMQCYIETNQECNSYSECYWAGSCSDSEYFFDLSSGLVGACVVGRQLSYNYFLYPYCLPPTVAFPNGCIDYSFNRSACIAKGYEWWEPSATYAECTNHTGCSDIYDELFQVGLQFAFSPKSYSDCLSTWNPGGTWQYYFAWTGAAWVNATARNLTWVPRNAAPRSTWNTSIDFDLAWNTYFEGAVSKSALDAKSATLCASSRLQQTLTAVTCDCAQNASTDASVCFTPESAAVPVAQGLPCSGVNTTVVSPSSIITFTPYSVNSTCLDVSVSEISQLQFQSSTQTTLSANFANFKSVNEFGFYNKHGVLVGTLLGNGVELLASGNITNVRICVTLRSTDKQGFPTFDFANTNSKYDKLYPRELKGVHKTGNSLCATIDLVGGEKATYFPVARDDNWDTNTSFFDPTTEGLSYTLAVLFLIVSVSALANLAHDGWVAISTRHNVDIQFYVVLFIFFFNFVRSIYFFIIPTGVSSLAVDFLMVVLPTFFYFTAFTLVILVWAVVCIKPLTQSVGEYMKYVRISAAIVNGVLYLFWIIIVGVFISLQKSPVDSPCGARVEETDNSNRLQKIVSVIYTTVIALVSLAIGVGFLYFGGRLFWQARQSGRKTNQKKIFKVAFICSVSFILHCVFLFVIVGLKEPVVAFSFVGLVVTEIAPSLFIVITFSKLHPQKMRSGSSKTTQAEMSHQPSGSASTAAQY